MKTFNDIHEGDLVYDILYGKLISEPVIREDEFDIIVRLSTDDAKFVIPKSEKTYYFGIYSCIEAIIKHLEDGI